MKKILIRVGVLAFVFLAAIVISSMVMNRGVDDQVVDMGGPTLPMISFQQGDEKINALAGYVNEMDITSMRDTITPFDKNSTLEMNLEAFGNQIDAIAYRVCSLDGEKVYQEEQVKEFSDDKVLLDLSDVVPEEERESVLEVILSVGEKKIHYYTRVRDSEELSVGECLSFAQSFHQQALKHATDDIQKYLETSTQGDDTTYQNVTIHSDVEHVTWGDLNPQIVEEVKWSIKESNSVYTSILAQYQVACEDEDGEIDTYNVKEFFRIRHVEGETYLLDYNRKMTEKFTANPKDFDSEGIILGIGSSDIPYKVSENGNITAFIQNDELWLYSKEDNQIVLVFSFANYEGKDIRSLNNQHEVQIITVENTGSMAFTVCGYMNRGGHEGEVGISIYYFDRDTNSVEEKVFIPSNLSYKMTEDELGEMLYYNHASNTLYLLEDGIFNRINLQDNEKTKLAENLTSEQYTVAANGKQIAYQKSGNGVFATQIGILDLESGEENLVNSPEGEFIRPLGFIEEDFVYGYFRESDGGKSNAGEELFPMYQLEIRDKGNEVVKTYSVDQIFVSNVEIEKTLITLNRVAKSGDVYVETSQDYISSNEEQEENILELAVINTQKKQNQNKLIYTSGIEKKAPKMIRPKLVVSEGLLTLEVSNKRDVPKYYVYGQGELDSIYCQAGEAIQRAQKVSGVVISSSQEYVWERGNRNLVFSIEIEPFGNIEGKTSLQTCEEKLKSYGEERINLSGCTLDQVLYVINKGTPVITMLESNHAVLLTAYTLDTITYIDPENAQEYTVIQEEFSERIEQNGSIFIGYM